MLYINISCSDPKFGASAQASSGSSITRRWASFVHPSSSPTAQAQAAECKVRNKWLVRWPSKLTLAAQARWRYENFSSRATRNSSNFRSLEVLLLESFRFYFQIYQQQFPGNEYKFHLMLTLLFKDYKPLLIFYPT